ncbi:MAG TPA: ABC transporter permease [Sedimenticola thiotaurini]|uniref:Arginine ABC transporter permease protein ArtM n=1 Tax=Sedimenticola thiotaurini TaxID=1543721 RepID=A0A831RGT0_9GAMM|nr:ABC transporter permease [Sedimenticola thiotaurini]
MNWNWSVIFDNFPQLLEGTGLTLELVALSLLAGGLISIPLALMRVSANPLVRGLPVAYTFFFRGTPLLVQLFLFYYGLAQFEWIRDSLFWPYLREAYWCALIVFTLNTGAYTTEILRGAIQAVPAGELEAAQAMGMSRFTIIRRITLPQAYRIALPAYSNEIILMLKGSALASTITLLDLTGMARTIIARTYMPIEIFFAAGCIYLALTFLFIQGYRLLERHLLRHQRPRVSATATS